MIAFDFLSMLLCGEIFTEEMGNKTIGMLKNGDDSKLYENMYVITGATGHFSINAYMYALMNNVILIGIPYKNSFADGYLDCPRNFMVHDLSHTQAILEKNKKETLENYADIYYKIHADSSLSRGQKEAVILVLFMLIHEMANKNIIHYINDLVVKGNNQNKIERLRNISEAFKKLGSTKDYIIDATDLNDTFDKCVKIFAEFMESNYM